MPLNLIRVVRLAATLGVLATAGCAGATVGSGVGDRFLERPPWYAGSPAPAAAQPRYMPVVYQRGGSQAEMFDPAGSGAVAGLLDDMNRYLDSLAPGRALRLAEVGGGAPDVQFGCETDVTGDCVAPDGPTGEVGDPVMRLAVARPSSAWSTGLATALEGDSALVLVLTLEVGQYFPQQTNFAGAKAVDLGTDHTVRLPWLTSLETPVSVVQLTGALVNRQGRAVRIGAEGMLARRTGLVQSGFGLQALIRDEDVAALRSARRADLPGEPLVWQVALQNLVSGLTGR